MNNKFSILVVDDEVEQRKALKGFLEYEGYSVVSACSYEEALKLFKSNIIDLVLTDYKLQDKTGQEILEEVKAINPTAQVIIMTAYGDIDKAVKLMKLGAFDFLQKPIDLDYLSSLIKKVEELNCLISENRNLKKQLKERYSFDSIISQSGEMEEVLNIAGRVANSKAGVMINGESGVGKELIAKAIHYASDRKNMPFITVNCAALPETLFESELFGHEKGAFTGADKSRIGKFEMADKGVLFLDEVGDIPLAVQVKLLRAIQFGQIEKLGSNKIQNLDVRIISATNRNLEEMVKNKEFREDLYYRLNVVTIKIPPLRKRRSEIPLLINHFIAKYSNENSKEVDSISKEAMDALMKYDYPGNVRELENIIQRAVVLSRNRMLTLNDLPIALKQADIDSVSSTNDSEIGDLTLKVEELEKKMIKAALEKSDGVQIKAAEALNISDRIFRYKYKKYFD